MTGNFGNGRRGRRSIRLKGFDYSGAGHYFVTLCTWNRECFFGCIRGGEMELNEAGRVVEKCWLEIPHHFPHSVVNAFVVMPNHMHGIIAISDLVGAKNFSPLPNILPGVSDHPNLVPEFRSPSRTIGSIIRGVKTGVSKWFRDHTDVFTVWQRNYFDHVIRNADELERIREYIRTNPHRWIDDPENPINAKCPGSRRVDWRRSADSACQP
jgi:REP element-mobilizing transposase RayT